MNLRDRVAIITGAAGGIGAAIAVGYAKQGVKVVIADILDGKKTVDAIEKAGSKGVFVETDVTEQAQCDAMAKAAVDFFGGIDILVNNAAMYANIIKKWKLSPNHTIGTHLKPYQRVKFPVIIFKLQNDNVLVVKI